MVYKVKSWTGNSLESMGSFEQSCRAMIPPLPDKITIEVMAADEDRRGIWFLALTANFSMLIQSRIKYDM